MLNHSVFTYFPVSLVNIIIGASAIIFNKYPSKKRSLEKIKKKYPNVNPKKIAQVDGIGYFLIAFIWMLVGVAHIKKSQLLAESSLIFIVIIGGAYFWLRDEFLNKNNGH